MTSPTDVDVERAHSTLFGEGTYEQRVAQLIADVRVEERTKRDAEAELARIVGIFKAWSDGDRSDRETLLQIEAILGEP